MTVPDPHLWWPNGHGEQPLYSALFSLLDGEDVIDEKEVRFGIRTVRLLQAKDGKGKSFIIEVNGRKIFCKGADWIPPIRSSPVSRPGTYDRLLRMAKDAHMNMIRVWGRVLRRGSLLRPVRPARTHGVAGLHVRLRRIPEAPWFTAAVRDEAEKAVARLRNHPSIVLWCGNNECEWLYCTEHPGESPTT